MAATWPTGVAALPQPADTDALGTGASMGGGITLADVLDTYALEVEAVETWLAAAPVNTNGSSGTTETMPDTAAYPMTALTLTANCALTFPTATAGKSFMLQLIQDSTGSRTVTWNGGTVRWAAGTAPTLSTAGNAVDIFTFICFGTHWYGFVAGQGMA